LLVAGSASAFCRTTTCDVDSKQTGCTRDDNMCATSGHPLFWPDNCSWFGVQKDGSPLRHITYDQMHAAVTNAFTKWGNADCGSGAKPSFALQDTDVLYAPIECAQREFNKTAANANTWMFRDTDWPYVDSTSTIALTTLSVEISTGRILDADVEINSFRTNITTSDVNVVADLESIVTHESGHFLGLAHSAVATATMYYSYSPSSVNIRTLDPDDELGICAAYPPGAAPICGQPEPIYGFSEQCGGADPVTGPDTAGDKKSSCAVSLGATSGSGALGAGVVLAGAALVRRRRKTM
jgi:MYXO-CTERM domain-containing protein